MTAWVIQIDGWDPVAAAAVTLRMSSDDDDRICHLNGQTWWPAIARLPVLSYDFFGGDFDAGRIETPSGACVLSVDPFPNLPRYALGGARFRLWGGEPGQAWGSWVLRFDGVVVAQPSIADGLARIDFRVEDRWADAPMLSIYAGSGGSEGIAELTGQPKPLAFGAPRFAGGTMINVTDNIVQLHSAGLIENVEVAFEALGRFGAVSADYANYGALLAASVPAGGWATSLAAGLVKFGAPPAGRLSFHVKGDKAGPGGWVQKPGAVINRIALLSGGTGKIATATMTALDSARPWNVSLALTEQVTARELVQRVAASVNAVAGISWIGKLWVQPIGIGTASLTLSADGTALPPVARVEQVGIAAPFWRLAIEAEPTWQVHAASEVALLDAAAGSTTATVYLYKRAASAPALPSASIVYDFTDGSATGITSGWTQAVPAADDNPVWVTTAYAIDTATTATIAAGDWAPPQILAQDGAPGAAAYALSPAGQSFTIACNSAGVPKAGEFNKVITFALTQGASDLSNDAATTYDAVTTSASTTWGGTNNKVLTISSMSGETASIAITVKRSGTAVQTCTVTLTKARDGSPGTQAQTTTFGANNNTASYLTTTLSGPLTLTCGASGSITAYLSHDYGASGANDRYCFMAGAVYYRQVGSPTWIQLTEEVDTFGAHTFLTTFPEPAQDSSIAFIRTVTALTPGTQYEFSYCNRRTSGAASMITRATSMFQIITS